MSFVAGSVIAKFQSDLAGLQQGIAAAKGALGGLKDSASGIQSKFDASFGGVTKAVGNLGKAIVAGTAIGGVGLAALGKQALDTAKDFEQSEIAFTTLLKDRGKALEAIKKIEGDAKATPYNLPDLIKANQLLISAGVSTEDARKAIYGLGNAVAATGGGTAELNRLAVNLQQIKAVGQASALDIKQFAFAGINVYQLLADYTGKNIDQVKEMNVTYDMLVGALGKASGAGGMFAGAMENQSKSMQGIMSNIQDIIGLGLKDILVQSGGFDAIKNGLFAFAGWLQEIQPKIVKFIQDTKKSISDFANSPFGKLIGEIFSKAFQFIVDNKDTILAGIAGIATALAGIMAVQGVISIIAGISAALTFLLSPVGLIIAGLALLFMAWQSNFLGIQDIVKGVWEFLKGAFEWLQGVPATIAEKWNQFQIMLQGVLTAVGELFTTFLGILMAVLQPILDYIMFWVNFWKWIFDNILFPVILLLSAVVARVVVEVYNFFVWLGEQIASVFKWINEKIIQPALTWITEKFAWLNEVVSGIWNTLLGIAKSVWESIKGTLSEKTEGARTKVSEILQAMKDFISNLFNSIWQGIKDMATKIYDAIVEPFLKAKAKIEEIAQGIKDAAEKISPFHKNSPSLVELVEKGTAQIAGMYSDLAYSIGQNDFKSGVMQFNTPQLAMAGAASSAPTVNQEITNIVNDRGDVDYINERLAFMYRNGQV